MRLVSVAFMAVLLRVSGPAEASGLGAIIPMAWICVSFAAEKTAGPRAGYFRMTNPPAILRASGITGVLTQTCVWVPLARDSGFLAIWHHHDAINFLECRGPVNLDDQPLKLPQL